jgi:hypothetical protein
VFVVLDGRSALDDIASGELCCPCGGLFRPWGHARVRLIRQLDGSHAPLRPRRMACAVCRRTRVLLPASSLPRRRDSVESIGAALLMAANGNGHRRIAADLDRPESTVRNWLRRARRGAGWLNRTGIIAAYEFDPGHGPMAVRATPIAEAVDALGYAAAAAVRRLGLVGVSPWSINTMVSRGRLLGGFPDG